MGQTKLLKQLTPYEVGKEMSRRETSPFNGETIINGKSVDSRKKRREYMTNYREIHKDNLSEKKADAYTDYAQDSITRGGLNQLAHLTGLDKYVGNIGSTASGIGSTLGFFGEAPTIDELIEMEENPKYGWIPGNAARRTQLRRKAVNKELGGKKSKIYSEIFGKGTSTLLAGLLGAGLGAGIGSGVGLPVEATTTDPNPVLSRALAGTIIGGVGGLMGGGITNLLGRAYAGVTDPRSEEEQRKYEQGSSWKNWVIPGYSGYNWYKSLGVGNRMVKKRKEERDKEKESKMKKESHSLYKLALASSYVLCKRKGLVDINGTK